MSQFQQLKAIRLNVGSTHVQLLPPYLQVRVSVNLVALVSGGREPRVLGKAVQVEHIRLTLGWKRSVVNQLKVHPLSKLWFQMGQPAPLHPGLARARRRHHGCGQAGVPGKGGGGGGAS